jgi:hypothetical protein
MNLQDGDFHSAVSCHKDIKGTKVHQELFVYLGVLGVFVAKPIASPLLENTPYISTDHVTTH